MRTPVLLAIPILCAVLSPQVSIAGDEQWWDGFGAQGLDGTVTSLAVFQNQLVAGGLFSNAGGADVGHIAAWDGSSWHALGSGVDGYGVYCLALYQGALIAGGYFSNAGGLPASNIARWDGTGWSPLGAGTADLIWCLGVHGEDLYAGGLFTAAGGIEARYIARWDGSSWSDVGGGMTPELGHAVGVFTLGELGADLIAGGSFRSAGPIVAHNIARWDGSSWHVMTAGTNGIVYAQAVYGGLSGGDLVAGGSFNVAGGVAVDRIAGWDGAFWYPLAGGLAGGDYSVDALTLLGPQLIAGGVFTLADSLPANRIAAWDGSSWTSLGSGTDGAVRALQVFDSQLYVGGTFSTAGGKPSLNIARWNPLTSSVSGPSAPAFAPLRIDARPNPFRESTRFACDLPRAGPLRIEIFDPLGRRLATVYEGDAPAGLHAFAWNGKDAGGVPLPRGAYLARVSSAGARGEIRITRIR